MLGIWWKGFDTSEPLMHRGPETVNKLRHFECRNDLWDFDKTSNIQQARWPGPGIFILINSHVLPSSDYIKFGHQLSSYSSVTLKTGQRA
jgi:hypothetical protein